MTDPSRRAFLGATAAVWGLPLEDQIQMYSDNTGNIDKEEQDYPSREPIGSFSGSLTAESYGDVEFSVSKYPHADEMPLGIELYWNGISLSAAMEPGEARNFARSLLDAADEIDAWRDEHWDEEMADDSGGAKN